MENGEHGKIRHVLTICYKNDVVSTVNLDEFAKDTITIGRAKDNDIVIGSSIVSWHHAEIKLKDNRCYIKDNKSTNGLLVNKVSSEFSELKNRDEVRIDAHNGHHDDGILMIYSCLKGEVEEKWITYYMEHSSQVLIGRDSDCSIVLAHNSISRKHTKIYKENNIYFIEDLKSTNGTFLNGSRLEGRIKLQDSDTILIGNTRLIFHKDKLVYNTLAKGVRLEGIGIGKTVTEKKLMGKGKEKRLLNDINLAIKPGELVALVGGSGAGKSTLMDAINGFRKATEGTILVNGDDFYENYNAYKSIMGYVPQQDIVYDTLSVLDMLLYAAELRMPEDTTKAEREERVRQVIKDVELQEREGVIIKNLSGGQKKRVSIAVELLADPKLFFLDEPTSGLDPGMERSMMQLLKKLSNTGKTIVLITHAMANLHLCDKVVFLGKGGRLCYFGSPKGALSFFEVEDYVDIYNPITNESERLEDRFKNSNYYIYSYPLRHKTIKHEKRKDKRKSSNSFKQFSILLRRYLKITLSDRQRVLMLMLQAPLISLLLAVVAKKNSFEIYENANQILFTLTCSAIWIGLFNSIQEVCKERPIYKRERAVTLKLVPYIMSKFVVLCGACLIQSVALVLVFNLFIKFPEMGSFFGSVKLEVIISTFLTSVSATALGLIISSMVSNRDKTMVVTPIILLFQIMFSGFIFKLTGTIDKAASLAISKWGVRAYGVSLDLNALPSKVVLEKPELKNLLAREADNIYNHEFSILKEDWLILCGFIAASIVLSILILKFSNSKE